MFVQTNVLQFSPHLLTYLLLTFLADALASPAALAPTVCVRFWGLPLPAFAGMMMTVVDNDMQFSVIYH